MGQQWTATRQGALGALDLGMVYTLLEEVAINPTIEPPEPTQDWETNSWWAQTDPCVHQDPGKAAVTPQETGPDLSGSVQESPVEAWVGSGLRQDWRHMHETF